jgi:aminoglycoside phosphotransferase (APT) family kinase protein
VHAYGRGAVVKVPAASTLDRWIIFEAQYAEAARACGAPVPRLLGIEQIGGRPASVWERVDGVSMWQRVVDERRHDGKLGVVLADVQLALFDLVPPLTLPAQRDRLVAKIRRAAATIEPRLARALDLLPRAPRAPRLCHGDLHPSNVLLSSSGAMVVDWFDASRGDAVADVARASLMLIGNETQAPAHLPGADPATLAAFNRAYLGRMTERLAIEPTALARWQAVNAVARMAEGVPRGPLLEMWNRLERPGDAHPVSG